MQKPSVNLFIFGSSPKNGASLGSISQRVSSTQPTQRQYSSLQRSLVQFSAFSVNNKSPSTLNLSHFWSLYSKSKNDQKYNFKKKQTDRFERISCFIRPSNYLTIQVQLNIILKGCKFRISFFDIFNPFKAVLQL